MYDATKMKKVSGEVPGTPSPLLCFTFLHDKLATFHIMQTKSVECIIAKMKKVTWGVRSRPPD